MVRVNPLRPEEKEWRKAVIIKRQGERPYIAETSDGGVYRRNRAHLKKTQESPPTTPRDQEPPLVENPEPEPTSKPDEAVLPDPRNSHQLQNIAASPSPMTMRPARVRRPPERFKDYVCH